MSSLPPPPPPPPAPSGWGGWAGAPPAAPSPWAWQAPGPGVGSGRFRAQSVGELLDAAFTLYRRNVRLIVSIAAVVQIPLAMLSYLSYQLTGVGGFSGRLQQLSRGGRITPQQLNDLRPQVIAFLAVAIGLALLQGLVVQPIATAALTRAVGDIHLERPVSLGGAYRAVAHRWTSVVGLALLLFAVALGLLLASAAVLVLAVLALGPAGGLLFLVVVPAVAFIAIVMYTRWLFAAPVVMLERSGAVAALRRSWQLVRGSTARVFGITLLVSLITGILGAIVGALLALATQVGDESVRLVLTQLATLVVSILVQPISYIVVVLLYYDVRIRREAFDIEMLAAAL